MELIAKAFCQRLILKEYIRIPCLKNTKCTLSIESSFFRNSLMASDETFAASSRGYPYAPVDIDGNASVFRLC